MNLACAFEVTELVPSDILHPERPHLLDSTTHYETILIHTTTVFKAWGPSHLFCQEA